MTPFVLNKILARSISLLTHRRCQQPRVDELGCNVQEKKRKTQRSRLTVQKRTRRENVGQDGKCSVVRLYVFGSKGRTSIYAVITFIFIFFFSLFLLSTLSPSLPIVSFRRCYNTNGITSTEPLTAAHEWITLAMDLPFFSSQFHLRDGSERVRSYKRPARKLCGNMKVRSRPSERCEEKRSLLGRRRAIARSWQGIATRIFAQDPKNHGLYVDDRAKQIG